MRLRHLVATALIFAPMVHAQSQPEVESPIAFTSSMAWMNESFRWAKQQALAYAHDRSSEIGPWYEAALPGRNAFCMRDVSHQTAGAAALGLSEANHNMLQMFAGSAVGSRDWASYWEITGEGKPSAEDYVSDNDFWFNLPANFDLLDASVRMLRWTGDERYRKSEVFQRFADITMNEYLTSWSLRPQDVLARPRIANQRLQEGRFVKSRGIPSYSEGTTSFIIGTDLLSAEYHAMQSFQEFSTDQTLKLSAERNAQAIQSLLDKVSWSEKDHHYLGMIRSDLSGYGSGDTMVLYFDAASKPERIRGALDYISSPMYWKKINIEEESYIALVLLRYNRATDAYEVLKDISSPKKARREYPEVSFSVISSIVNGVMGLTPGTQSDTYDIATLSRVAGPSQKATLSDVAIRHNMLEISHTGFSSTRLKNLSGPTLRWRAEFSGTFDRLKVDGRQLKANHSIDAQGVAISWVDVTVDAGKGATVSR